MPMSGPSDAAGAAGAVQQRLCKSTLADTCCPPFALCTDMLRCCFFCAENLLPGFRVVINDGPDACEWL